MQIKNNFVCNILVPEYPQLTNIGGRTDSDTYNTLQVSFFKWNQQMIGNTAPTEYVVTCNTIIPSTP